MTTAPKQKKTKKPLRHLPKLRALVLINEQAGTVRSVGIDQILPKISDALSPYFLETRLKPFSGDIAEAFAKEERKDDIDVLIAGGGDGTLASAARLVIDNPKLILGVLPLGTMNLFAQSLGFPPALEATLAIYGSTKPMDVDVGQANDKIFLHQFSMGLQPQMARLRERMGYRSRLTKMIGSVRAFLLLAFQSRKVHIDLETDGDLRRVKAQLLTVTNNLLSEKDGYHIAKSLEEGLLGIYELKGLSLKSLIPISRDYLARRIHENPLIEVNTGKSVMISRAMGRGRSKKRMKTAATIDGELVYFEFPIKIEIKNRSLRVLRPKPSE